MRTRIKYTDTALPTDSDTFVLYDSSLDNVPIAVSQDARFVYSIHHDQTATVKGYSKTASDDNWREFTSTTHAGASTPAVGDVFIVGMFHVKFEWVNGGVTQTVFTPTLALDRDRSASS